MSDDIRTMFDETWLKAWDFPADTVVTIERIEGGTVTSLTGKEARKPICHFKGWPRPLALNKTNVSTIARIYGTTKAAELRGKRVTLYATTCQGAQGGDVDCVRIRPTKPTAPGVPEGERRPVDQAMRARQEAHGRAAEQSATGERQPGEEG